MSAKHLKRTPNNISKKSPQVTEAWWHEDNYGAYVCFRVNEKLCTYSIQIPWTSLRAALKRKDKP